MIFQDYYKILGVDKTANEADIKKAYRRLAKLYHPDKTQGDKASEEKFKQVAEAYEVLNDPEKRRKFDEFLITSQSKQHFAEKTHYSKKGTYTYKDIYEDDYFKQKQADKSKGFSDFFKEFFGAKTDGAKSDLYKGENVKGKLTIDLEEAYLGSTRILTINNEKLRLRLKPGVTDEQILKVKGKGKPGILGGDQGDLYVRIIIRPHHIFERKGIDLYRDIYIDIYTAILGGKVEVLTLKGEMNIQIPMGIEYGKSLRLRGLGMPDYDHPEIFGDLYVNVKYVMPKTLSDEEVSLIKRLQNLYRNKN
jgi:curved DNA-binding protein